MYRVKAVLQKQQDFAVAYSSRHAISVVLQYYKHRLSALIHDRPTRYAQQAQAHQGHDGNLPPVL